MNDELADVCTKAIKDEKVLCSIITYNPDIEIFEKCLQSASKQVKNIILWDNSSDNIKDIRLLINSMKDTSIQLREHKENFGIAKSLNEIFKYAEENSFDWVLTLDHDSIIPDNMLTEYMEYFNYKNIGMIGCWTLDRNDSMLPSNLPAVAIVEDLITSGSLTNVKAWNSIGGFDEKLFIDSVDKDYCLRLIQNAFTILRVNSVRLSHAIGDKDVRRILGLKIVVYNHSYTRKYYQIRNMFYLDRKYGKCHTLFAFRHFIIMLIKILVYEKDKKRKIQACIRGAVDGLRL